jgi:DNA-binding transcriptional MerR regulator
VINGGDQKSRGAGKSEQAFRTISEVADELDLPQHVLRFWETKFTQVAPMKRGGGRRYYRPEDVETLRRIKALLHHDGYTIKGVQKLLGGGGVNNLPPARTPEPPENGDNAAVVPEMEANVDVAALGALVNELEEIRDQLKKSVS